MAQTLTVTTLFDEAFDNSSISPEVPPVVIDGDTGDGLGLSLREAIGLAALYHAFDGSTTTIEFGSSLAGSVIHLSFGSGLVIEENITVIIDGDIDNDGFADITVSGDAGTNDTTTTGPLGNTITDVSINASTVDNVQVFSIQENASATLSGLVITGGVATQGGGIDAHENTNLVLEDSVVAGNLSVNAGGGIAVEGVAHIRRTSISENSAGTDAGGLFVGIGGNATLTDTTVTGNTAQSDGGGIFNSTQLSLIATTVSGNSATYGAGLYNTDTATLENSTVSGNAASLLAGAIWNRGQTSLVNVDVSNNTSVLDGGALINVAGTATLTNSDVSGNIAGRNGGAVFNQASLLVTDTLLSGNIADIGGGLINLGNGADATLINTSLVGNAASYGGGGIWNQEDLILTNATLAGNTATQGGGLANVVGQATITQSTVSGNSALVNGGGLWNNDALPATLGLANNILLGNSAPVDPELFEGAVGATTKTGANIIGQSLFVDEIEQTGVSFVIQDVFAQTTLIDPDQTPNSGDEFLAGQIADNGGRVQTIALKAGVANPAIGVGDASLLPADTADLDDDTNTIEQLPLDADRNARVFDTLDIGAVEAPAIPLLLVTTANDVVDANDGLTSLREALALANSTADADNDGNANDTIEFDATVFRSGATITLAQGQLEITSDITLNGDVDGDGIGDVKVDADDLSRVFLVNTGTSTFNGLTITGGNAENGGGVLITFGADLSLTNSTVSENTAQDTGAGIDIFSGSASLVNTTLSGNSSDLYGGALFLGGGTNATLVNVTIDGNDATQAGGGISTAFGANIQINNSTITNNTVTGPGVGGGIELYSNTAAQLTNTVVALNSANGNPDDITDIGLPGTLTAAHSFFGTTVGIDVDQGGNINDGGDPLLAAIADSGGPVQTRLPQIGSPLIGAGNDSLLPADTADLDGDTDFAEPLPLDGNGRARVTGNGLDIGAAEQAPETPGLLVTTDQDVVDAFDGQTSLREALAFANSTADADNDGNANDTIEFDPGVFAGGGTITLTQGQLEISSDITIDGDADGNGTGDVMVDADDLSRVFLVSTGTSFFNGLTITGGNAENGGGIQVGEFLSTANLTATNVVVSGNSATLDGGGIEIANGGVTLVDTTLTGNTADRLGGGIDVFEGDVELINTTLNGNSAGSSGGAIHVFNSNSATLVNVTIDSNSAESGGGGISTFDGAELLIDSSTITQNAVTNVGVGGGIELLNGTSIEVINTVVAQNTANGAADDISEVGLPSTLTAAHSFFGTTVGIDVDQGGNINGGGDPLLAALADNGGSVQTRLPQVASPLIGAGNDRMLPADVADLDGDTDIAEPLPLDANGGARVTGDGLDIGAAEQAPETPGLLVTTDQDVVDAFDGLTSLREALALANSTADADNDGNANDTIAFDPNVFAAGGTITLTQGQLEITSDITLNGDVDGDNRADVTVDADNSSRVFLASSGTSSLNGLTITGGNFVNEGGGIVVGVGDVSSAFLTLTNTTVSGNTAFDFGGGIVVNTGEATLVNTTLSGNSASTYGGAIFVGAGQSATLVNVTIDGNSAGAAGGGISTDTGATLIIDNSTITNNTSDIANSGGGIELFSNASAQMTNTVLALNTAAGSPNDFAKAGASPSTLTAANSFFGMTVGIDVDQGGNINNGGDPLLAALADNGGSVQTRLPQLGGQLIGGGNDSLLPADATDLDGDTDIAEPLPLDANGGARVTGNGLDIGAAEQAPETPGLLVTTDQDVVDAFDGLTSLREALAFANSTADADNDGTPNDSIEFDAGVFAGGGTIILTQGQLEITSDITIDGDVDGDSRADVTLNANNQSRVLHVASGTSSLNGLTITNGSDDSGAGIRIGQLAELTISNTTVSGSTAGINGGGIYTDGALNMVNTTLTGNSAPNGVGGGLYASAQNDAVSLVNVTIDGNTAGQGGGGIQKSGSQELLIDSSTITNNAATAASSRGGGIELLFGTSARLTNTVVALNTSSGVPDDVTEFVLIPSALTAANSFFGTTVSFGDDQGGNINGGGDPLLAALADNGGAVQTRLPQVGSQLIGAGNDSLLPADAADLDGDTDIAEPLPLDANGNVRVIDNLDIGAVEVAENPSLLVTTADDVVDAFDGLTSLREALALANSTADADNDGTPNDTIEFDAGVFAGGGTIILTQGQLEITSDTTINGDVNGDDRADVTIDGNDQSRVLQVSDGTSNLNGLNITGGYDASSGAGISVGVNFVSSADLTLTNTSVSNNEAGLSGGGIFIISGSTALVNTTLSGNSAGTYGGGLFVGSGNSATLVNATIDGNSATANGGGGITVSAADIQIDNSTITNNTVIGSGAGGGIELFEGSTARVTNTVVASNSAAGSPDDITEVGFNPSTLTAANSFFGTTVGIDVDQGGNINNGGDPQLAALADNGGAVQTRLPQAGSPLINAGDAARLPADAADLDRDTDIDEPLPLDASGGARVVGDLDIGAFEVQDAISDVFLISGEPAALTPFVGQNQGTFSISPDGLSLRQTENSWTTAQLPDGISVTPNTVLTFDFEGVTEGEIHGIEFTQGGGPAADRIFKLWGTQDYGIDTFGYGGSGLESFEIPVGEFFTGDGFDLRFISDDDAGGSDGGTFSNLRFFEKMADPGLLISGVAYIPTEFDQQNGGDFLVSPDMLSLNQSSNAWTATAPMSGSSIVVTEDTVLAFDFSAPSEGEIHGVAFTRNGLLREAQAFKIYGTQGWGVSDFDTYDGDGVDRFEIPVGQFFQGNFDELVFFSDQDFGSNGGSIFADITLIDIA